MVVLANMVTLEGRRNEELCVPFYRDLVHLVIYLWTHSW